MKKDLKTWLPKNKKQGTWLPKLSSLKHWSSILYQFGFFIIFSDITDQSCWRRAKGADMWKLLELEFSMDMSCLALLIQVLDLSKNLLISRAP